MSVISRCHTLTDSTRELQGFQQDLDAITSEFVQALNDVTQSQAAVDANAMADQAFAAANQMLGGNLSSAMSNAGLAKPDESFEESRTRMMNEGYLFTGSRAWFCSTPTWRMHRVDGNTMYKSLGVQQGEYTLEALQTVLKDYVEPDYKSVLRSQRRRSQSATGANEITGSTVSQIGPVYSGNVSALREIYIGCGSQVSKVTEVLDQTIRQGWNVVWSKPDCRSVLRPLDVPVKEFTSDKAKSLAGTSVRESDWIRVSDDEYLVLSEVHVASNCDRNQALEKAVASQLVTSDWDSNKLICRIISGASNETVRDQAPVFVSQGFDESRLGTDSCLIGVTVSGIARVIDVTSDGGYRISADKYTASDIAHAIRTVFPDLVETGVLGNEWYVTTKSSGADASLGFFVVNQRDASQAVGIAASIQQSFLVEFSGTNVSSLEIVGGATASQEFPPGLLKALAGLELDDVKRSALLTDPRNYWTNASPGFNDLVAQQQAAVATGEDSFSDAEYLMPITGFMYLEDFRCREALAIIAAVGNDFDMLMRQTDVIAIDTYTDAATVRTTLKADIEKLAQGQGVQSATTYGLTITARESCYKQASTAYMLAWGIREFGDRGNQSVQQDFESRLSDALSQTQAIDYSLATTAGNETAFVGLIRLADDYTALLNRLPDTGNELVEESARALAALTTSFLKSEFPDEYRKFVNAVSDVESVVTGGAKALGSELDDSLSIISGLERAFASGQSLGLRLLQRANAVLTSVTPVVYSYATAYQTTYKKLASLTGMNLNIFKSAGTSLSSKFVSCYATGEVSLAVQRYLTKFLDLLNKAAAAINEILQKIIDAVRKFINKMLCVLNGIKAAASGLISYSSTYPIGGGVVSLNVTCTVNSGVKVDSEIMANLSRLCDQVTGMLAMFQLHLITFTVQSTTTDQLTKQAQSQLLTKFKDSLNDLAACFG